MEKLTLYILSLKINGIKNIKKEVELSFYNSKISKNFNPSLYNIKAIYGENGVGKSGIINALFVTKNIVQNSDYLKQRFNQELLLNLINKENKKFEIEIEFLIKIEKNIFIYNYRIVLEENRNKVNIIYESLKERPKTKKTYTDLINIENGKIINIRCNESLKNKIEKITNNLLSENSFLNIVMNDAYFLKAIKDNELENSKFLLAIVSSNTLFSHMTIYMDQNDTHENYIIRNFISMNRKSFELIGKEVISPLISLLLENHDYDLNQINIEDNIVKKTSIKIFENNIKKLTKFIQVFKPDLNSIDIEKKIDKDYYLCRLVMNYGKYKINTEYESNGVKKLIKMFNALSSLNDGNIVLIDEMDSNIHDVYLCKMIQYFDKYSNGQLCFTTHNLSPMTLLSKRKKGIDFISRDGDIVSWTTNGNRSAISYYQNGMVDKCPFNLQYFDFLEVFEGE